MREMRAMKSTRIRLLLFVLCVSLSLTVLPGKATACIPENPVVLYAMDDWAQDYLTIPESHPQSFQIPVENAEEVSYSLISGKSVAVSATGLVTPKIITWYWYSGGSYSYGTTVEKPELECLKITHDIEYGTSKIRVTADGVEFEVTVEVRDYAEAYADSVIDQYIQENITEGMTLEEQLEAICKFPAGYDYSARHSSATRMIAAGGGDCWASTGLILEVCERLGLEAKARNGNRDPGAGSGHMNALVIIGDGDYYELDAGYSGSAPRPYHVTHRSSLFCYRSIGTAGGIEVYQYDGDITADTVLEVPATLNGHTVESIGEGFVALSKVKEVVLPDALKRIRKSAFNSCTNLQTLHIPASVSEIGDFVFTKCTALTEFTCSDDNPSFCTVDNVLYNKGMDTVVAAPACAAVVLPDTVQTIGTYAFYYNANLQQVKLPASVNILKEGAFANCGSLERVIVEGKVKVGEYAFAGCTALNSVAFGGDGDTVAEHAFHKVTANVCYPGDNSTWTSELRQNYSGTLNWVEGHGFENGACIYCDTADPTYGILEGILTTCGSGETILTLTATGETGPAYTVTLTDGSYHLQGILPGEYTLTLTKDGNVTRSYTRNIDADENVQNLQLCLPGDVNGDGKLNIGDVSRIYAHSKGSGMLEEYAFLCADLNADGRVNIGDAARVYAYARGTGRLS